MQHIRFNEFKENNWQTRTLYSVKITFRNEGEIKTFSDKVKLRGFIMNTHDLKQMQKEIVK